MQVAGRNIVVAGLARSGRAAARFLAARGARVTVSDRRPAAALGPAVEEMRVCRVALELGGHLFETFRGADLVVVSPGVPLDIPALAAARGAGVPVLGELALAATFLSAPLVAVTGTNGKTTTTEWIGTLLARCGIRAAVGGNVGTPLISLVDRRPAPQVVVAEVSSFQLDSAPGFHPRVAVLLNISPDHLDRYADFDAYARSKGAILRHQEPGDTAVINAGDARVAAAGAAGRGRPARFGRAGQLGAVAPPEARIDGDGITLRWPPHRPLVLPRADLRLEGRHHLENAAAAALAVLAVGGRPEDIRRAVPALRGLAHRLEPVAVVNGVRFVNDSKATNLGAVSRALESVAAPVVLIMGGRDKGGDFSQLGPAVRRRVHRLVAMGEAGDAIAAALAPACRRAVHRVAALEEAVERAFGDAPPGAVVLLSPGCTSFDQFDDYAQRGDAFKHLVGRLARRTACDAR